VKTFVSIRVRLMAATALLIIAIVGAVSWLWATTERDLIRAQFMTEQAKSLVSGLAKTNWGLVLDNNWGQLRMNLDLMMQEHPEFVYIFVSDDRQDGQIRAASPPDLVDDFIPDVVPPEITHAQLAASTAARGVDTVLLRDVEFPAGSTRGRRGDRIIEVAADVRLLGGDRFGTIRIGLSTAKADSAVRAAMLRVLGVGVLGLLAGLLGAVFLAARVSGPVRRLQASATRIAAGDFVHRADVKSSDEIGALAEAFNQMTAALERSFAKLRATLASFERFVPRKFLQVVAPEGLENIVVGTSTTKRVTILFSDIRGYTTISETSTPKEIFVMLNEYLGEMGDAIDNHGGFIDKYIGDAIMALFDDEHTDEALAAALAMRRRLAELNARRRERGLAQIDSGIGMHCGDVEMGTIGFSAKVESTVIGDPVNVASRIEGLTKGYGVAVLVTAAVVEALREPKRFDVRLVDASATVKGKGEAIAVYEVREAVAAVPSVPLSR
jgi:class 3 adenylate cyclase